MELFDESLSCEFKPHAFSSILEVVVDLGRDYTCNIRETNDAREVR